MTETAHADICQIDSAHDSSNVRAQRESSPVRRPLSLEEENRQLKEARLCKVCMDSEVSIFGKVKVKQKLYSTGVCRVNIIHI